MGDGPWSTPDESGRPRRSSWLIGAAIALTLWIVVPFIAFRTRYPFEILGVSFLLAVIGGTVATVTPRTRTYATGFLIVGGAVPVVLAGVCIVLIASSS